MMLWYFQVSNIVIQLYIYVCVCVRVCVCVCACLCKIHVSIVQILSPFRLLQRIVESSLGYGVGPRWLFIYLQKHFNWRLLASPYSGSFLPHIGMN